MRIVSECTLAMSCTCNMADCISARVTQFLWILCKPYELP